MRIAGIAGLATPVVWFTLLFVAGAQRPGYDHLRQYMTELQTGGLVQRLSMLVTDLWPAVIGWRLVRLAGSRSPSASPART